MGVDQAIYLGPYIRAKKEIVEIEEDLIGCRRCKKEDDDHKFCQDCGDPLTSFKKKRKGPKADENDIEKFGTNLKSIAEPYGVFDEEYQFFIPDRVKDVKRSLEEDEDGGWTNIGKDVIAEELALFKVAFPKQLAWVHESYSEYHVEWGLLVYYY